MVLYLSFVLESMDVVGRIPHPNPTQPDAVSDAVARVLVPRLSFFFSRIRTDSASIHANLRRTKLIRPDSGRIGQRLKWPKQAKIGLEYRQKSQNSHLRGILMCFLPSSFFVL